MRILAILAGTLVLGAASADAASAGSITANLSVQGAGTVSSPTGKGTSIKCDQADPVSGAAILTCPNNPWTKSATGPATMTVTAAPAAGWSFDGWGNCPTPAGASCSITTLSTLNIAVRARFVDTTKPEKVPNLKVEGTGVAAPTHVVKWDSTEAGLTWKCAVDGGALETCKPGLGLSLPEGEHQISVGAVDLSGNAGTRVSTTFAVVDTKLLAGPNDGSTVAAVKLSATSGIATDFECSWDGGAFTRCGRGTTPDLTVPTLGDGAHSVQVRGRFGSWVDPTPVLRKFTLDATAPETTVRKVDDRMEFGANEPASFRCSLDGQAEFVCASPYYLPDLAAGPHAFEVYSFDRTGNRDLTPARADWTIAAPTPVPTPTPMPTVTPTPDPAPAVTTPAAAAPAAVAPAILPAQRLIVAYTYRKGFLTRLAVDNVPAGEKLVITVKCPKRKGCPKSPTTVRKLVGKRLAKGTRITFTAGTAKRTIKL